MPNRQARRAAKRASLQQLQANRENAQLSTGPVTPEGKETSKMNATKHALTSMRPYLPAEEQDYFSYAADRVTRFAPETPLETGLVQTIIDVEWRLKRIPCLEARLFACLEQDDQADAHKSVRSLDTLSRHESRLRKLHLNTVNSLHDAVQMRRKFEAAARRPEEDEPAHGQPEASQPENGFVLQTPPAAAASYSSTAERIGAEVGLGQYFREKFAKEGIPDLSSFR